MNVFDFALKMEVDGKAYYEKLAKKTDQPGLKTIFTRLAEDEQKHYDIFQELKAGAKAPAMPETTIQCSLRWWCFCNDALAPGLISSNLIW